MFDFLGLFNGPFNWLLIFGVLVLLLMYLYKIVGQKLQRFSLRLFRSSIVIYYFFFLGIVIHELSHFFACLVLGVRVRKVVLFYPKREENSDYYRLGYVEHASVGAFRSALVGVAPAILCSLFTLFLFIWASKDFLQLQSLNINSIIGSFKWMLFHPFNYKNYVFLYFAVACALSGEPSGEDLQSIPKVLRFLFLGGLFLYLINHYLFDFGLVSIWYKLLNLTGPLFMGLSFIIFFEISVLLFIYLVVKFIFRIR